MSHIVPLAERHPRKAISKKTRFEVFKRDCFTCQYCGATPPAVVLEVDHILAVAAGGRSHQDNYATACNRCNRGKGAADLKEAPKSLSDRAKDVAEREAQLLGYQAVMEARRTRLDDEMWRVAEVIDTGSSERGMSRNWTGSIRRFIDRMGLFQVLEFADAARSKIPYGGKQTFLYFCGMCWRHLKQEDESRNA
jgi:hypothetical protein